MSQHGLRSFKALLRNAEIAAIVTQQAELFGIAGDVTLDYRRAVSRSREVADARVRGVHFLMRKNGITEIDGRGRFTGPRSLHVDLGHGETKVVTFDHAVVATGSRVPTLPGVAVSDNVVTYEQQILSTDLPESIVIIGAGSIGMEFGYILHSYGVHVEILEFADRVLPNEDPDVSRELQRQYRRRGITVHTSTRVDKVVDHGDHVVVSHTRSDGTTSTARATRAFICIGFAPNIEGIGLDAAGVRLTARGAIEIDDYMRTSAPHIHAVGDVTAKVQLAHVASAQGDCCRSHRRRGNDAVGLPDDAASDILPAASRQLRLYRRAGSRCRLSSADRHLSYAGQLQSTWPG